VSAHLSAGPASRDQPTRVQAQAAACLAAWASPAAGRPGRRHGHAWQRGTPRSPLPVFRILRHLSQVTACPRRRRRAATAPLGRRRRTRISPRFGALGVGSWCGGLRACGVTHITDRGRRAGLRPCGPCALPPPHAKKKGSTAAALGRSAGDGDFAAESGPEEERGGNPALD
jgi:hypothetical protein